MQLFSIAVGAGVKPDLDVLRIPPFAKRGEGPRISNCAALAIVACATFSKERRMKFVDPTKPYRKSGGWGTPGFAEQSAFQRFAHHRV